MSNKSFILAELIQQEQVYKPYEDRYNKASKAYNLLRSDYKSKNGDLDKARKELTAAYVSLDNQQQKINKYLHDNQVYKLYPEIYKQYNNDNGDYEGTSEKRVDFFNSQIHSSMENKTHDDDNDVLVEHDRNLKLDKNTSLQQQRKNVEALLQKDKGNKGLEQQLENIKRQQKSQVEKLKQNIRQPAIQKDLGGTGQKTSSFWDYLFGSDDDDEDPELIEKDVSDKKVPPPPPHSHPDDIPSFDSDIEGEHNIPPPPPPPPPQLDENRGDHVPPAPPSHQHPLDENTAPAPPSHKHPLDETKPAIDKALRPQEEIVVRQSNNNPETIDFETENIDRFQQPKEEIPDVGIFRTMLHALTDVTFNYLEDFIPHLKMLNELTPINLRQIMKNTMDTITSGGGRHLGQRTLRNGRIKLQVKDKLHEEHSVWNNAVLFPFMIIGLQLYLARKGRDMMGYGHMIQFGLKQVFKHMGMKNDDVQYFFKLYNEYPKELTDIFLQSKTGIRENVNTLNIKKYIQNTIYDGYEQIYEKPYREAVKKYELGGTQLIIILDNLSNPSYLFEIYQVFETIDNFMLNISQNHNIVIGLFGLIYNLGLDEEDADLADAILANASVDGIIYYNRKYQKDAIKQDVDLLLMKEMSNPKNERFLEGWHISTNTEKVAKWDDDNNNSVIIFRGTDFKRNFVADDFIQNVLNFASSDELFNHPKYNKRYELATSLLRDKLREIRNTGKGSVKVLGYSLGGAGALRMAYLFPNVPVKIFDPVISNSEKADEFMRKLAKTNPNVEFVTVEEDPLASNLLKYKDI